MSRWIKNKNTYYYVKYDESEEMRLKYSSNMLRYNIMAFDFVQQPKKFFNTDIIVENIMNQLSIDDKVKDIVKRDFKLIREDHLQFLIDNNIRIFMSMHETYYSGQYKSINIDLSQSSIGMVAHEMGHMFVDINNLYENEELKVIMQEIFDHRKGIETKIINGESYIYVKSEKFIRKYQGRTYILEKDFFGGNINLDYTKLEEYIAVGFETFVINPKLLYTRDMDLYKFFENGGLLE